MQLLNTVKAEADYASSRASMDRRQVKWLLSAAQRKALPAGVLHRLQSYPDQRAELGRLSRERYRRMFQRSVWFQQLEQWNPMRSIQA